MLRQYELVDRVLSYDPDADEAMLNRAYVFSVNAHGTQKRASGDPYFSHPIEVAGILTDLHLDDETIVTAILHDTVEDTVATPEDIQRLFGDNVARMVDGVTKLSKIEAQTESERAAENLRKFLLAMSDDVRVLLVKLADRLHNMRTLHHIKNPDKRKRIARETMDIYAPLAERIGMYEFMKEMQTLAFRELEPEAYESIEKRLDSLKIEGEDRIAKIASGLKLLLSRGGIEAEITGREKHPYSIWKKMSERHVSLEQLSDIMAFRAIVDTEEECYRALGVIHRRWPMVPGRFKDYISTPKRNGYRSLHTSIIHAGDTRIEIQIRTRDMHAQAEYGLAAHWAYKASNVRPDTQVSWIKDLIEILEHAESPEELLEHTRMAMYQDRIFAFTPKGELIQLPKRATPIDFAYAVHSNLGDQAVGAKINGRVVPLRTEIEQGDQVQILRSKAQEPQANWLNFAITGKARAAIRRHIRHKEREETIALGHKLYDEIVLRLPTPPGDSAIPDALKRLKLQDEASLMEAIARRQFTDFQVMEALMPGSTEGEDEHDLPPQQHAIEIKGLTPGVAFHFSVDCRPVPGDRIVGIRRAGEPIEVHRIDCPSLADTTEEDWVDLTWGNKAEGGIAQIEITLKNEPGALGAVATLIGQHKANILGLRMDNRDTTFHTNTMDLEVRNAAHLMRLLAALRAADAVSSAERA
ncbi:MULTISPECIES: bifunctional (p)ppGpp synthetase/guanosine-3',5'-bis(diphosphate) 3'-pyrophosphohydrolase [Sphingomonas]|uniref:GTP pyrophosphokinase rsh n=1 Tax=Sphingomonas leidyi TaxID=68569 RepID=A0A7X5V240_9SPHN|nr:MULTISPECIES: bifunctional (p)ppGpp synthetase/guanosine-3',5'-bis(diphosphate) 3'-pyrophosphohydrolase [unclassified Sphingomonas]MBN8809707.1 bifunctional (p)ppGpp synthetase/guanosine-3',5'-bis(diphosphate) 3'-pyrophosphohydrolase [Sphingomonas sp.]NIJ66130.1 RelA/SpoT family (p)ppGpp synthetase [Sphingomonas leidyi]OJY50346.1 MAG: bifunctional (p)ppGpp synthetase/guanosine-3',5'-bis(diphosphate) 3'-pyrophosphohydrolase [Sphingomonas sp. 67-41]